MYGILNNLAPYQSFSFLNLARRKKFQYQGQSPNEIGYLLGYTLTQAYQYIQFTRTVHLQRFIVQTYTCYKSHCIAVHSSISFQI